MNYIIFSPTVGRKDKKGIWEEKRRGGALIGGRVSGWCFGPIERDGI